MDVNFSPNHLAGYFPAAAIKRNSAYTVVELLVVVAVISVLLMIAAPAMTDVLQTNRIVGTTNSLISALQYARSEAIKRNSLIVICKGTANAGCDHDSDWNDGWIVFADTDRDHTIGDDEQLLLNQAAIAGGITVTLHAAPTSNWIAYYPGGIDSSNGTFTICDERGSAAAHAVIIARTGRVRASLEAADGSALQCL